MEALGCPPVLTEGPSVAASMLGLAQNHLKEEDESPGFASALTGIYRTLRGAVEWLVDADSKVSAAAARESMLRNKHRILSKFVGKLIIALRRTVRGQYVEPDLENLGLQTLDAEDSITVSRQSRLISERFGSDDVFELLGDARFAEPVDLTPYVEEIRTKSEELFELAEDINLAQRETASARLLKNQAMEEYNNIFLRSARSPEGPDPLLEHNLKVMAKTLRTTPELAYGGFVTSRSSFVVPVPGIIAERPGFLPSGVVYGGLVGLTTSWPAKTKKWARTSMPIRAR